jgi:hypothetical protein
MDVVEAHTFELETVVLVVGVNIYVSIYMEREIVSRLKNNNVHLVIGYATFMDCQYMG